MKARIHQNIWGNWNGYIGTRRVIEFGTSHFDAKLWLAEVNALSPIERRNWKRTPREFKFIVKRESSC